MCHVTLEKKQKIIPDNMLIKDENTRLLMQIKA